MNTGDIVIRHKSGHNSMKVGDIDEIKRYRHSLSMDLKNYGNGHSGESLRLATEEEKFQYYAMQGVYYYKEANYEIF